MRDEGRERIVGLKIAFHGDAGGRNPGVYRNAEGAAAVVKSRMSLQAELTSKTWSCKMQEIFEVLVRRAARCRRCVRDRQTARVLRHVVFTRRGGPQGPVKW